MKLDKILSGVNSISSLENSDLDIDDIFYDSRYVKPNSIFVCLTGKSVDGHEFATDAINRGASVVICERDLGLKNQIIVENSREVLAKISSNFFGNPSGKLKIVGITGTKGKTTVASFISKILNNFGYKTVQIGTLGAVFEDEVIKTKNTTPESYEIQKLLKKAVDSGYKYAVIEASSIGLKDHRLDEIFFHYGVFTNISDDHIGGNEHPDFEDYKNSKFLLFKRCKTGIINIDDLSYKQIMLEHSCKILTYGFSSESNFRCSDYKICHDRVGSTFKVNERDFSISIPGKYNVYNAIASIIVCTKIGVTYESIRRSLTECKVCGRSEIVFKNSDIAIIIDYAHNSLGLESLLTSLREYKPKRLVTMFGAGGNRVKSRRFSMGRTSGILSDLTVITSDNSRYENPLDIIEDIKQGISSTRGEYVVVPDRRDAIKYCIKNSQPGDIIVLAGKGHETYQEINGTFYDFDERAVVKEALSECKII